MSLRPINTIQKVLISTTSRLVGEFETEGILLTHAWPNMQNRFIETRWSEGPISRSSYVFAFQTEEVQVESGPLPEYSHVGDLICAYLAVLFGKRFDNHGMIEGTGQFRFPDLSEFNRLCRHNLPHNSHKPRPDFAVPLNLVEVRRIGPLLIGDSLNEKFTNTFQTCAKFYLNALQNFERDSEIAYLSLITTGEILSNYFEYDNIDLLDDEIKGVFQTINTKLSDGAKIVRILSRKLLSIKKCFLKTILDLIDDSFFSRSESSNPIYSFNKDSFEKSIAAAYDLRSRYVHTGVSFGSCVSRTVGGGNNEVQFGTPYIEEDRKLGKLIGQAPTLIGLERVIRYALLKFAEANNAYVHAPMSQN